MNKLVLDASVALKSLLSETGSPEAIALVTDYVRGASELIAPDTLPIEVAHVLTRTARQGIIPSAEAQMKLTDFMTNAPVLHSYLPLLARAVEISTQIRVGVFDCLYLALAEQESCQVATSDLRLVRAIPALAVDLMTI